MRIFALGIFALTIIYLSLFLYIRAGRQEVLVTKGLVGSELRDRLASDMNGLGAWLAVWVYAVPLAITAVVIYLLNNS